MEQRLLGKSGLSLSVLSFGTMTVGGRDRFQHMGNLGVAETQRMLDICAEAGRHRHRYRRHVFVRRRRGGPRRGAAGEAPAVRDRDQGLHAGRPGRPRYRPLAQAHRRKLRGQPAAAAHRLSRRLHVPRAGSIRAGRGDAARVRRPGQPGQGPLHRLFQSFRLARDEGAGRVGAAHVPALHHASRSTTRWWRGRSSTRWCRWGSIRASA